MNWYMATCKIQVELVILVLEFVLYFVKYHVKIDVSYLMNIFTVSKVSVFILHYIPWSSG